MFAMMEVVLVECGLLSGSGLGVRRPGCLRFRHSPEIL